MGVIISAFIAVILFLLAAGVGLSVLKLFRLSTIKPEDAGVYGAALGIGLFGYLILAVGIAGQFNLVAVLVGLAALVVPALLGLNWLCRLWRENREVVEPGVEKSRPFLWWVSVSVIGLVAVCGVIAALAPQFGADTLRYHLAAPKWFIRVGRVEFVPFLFFNLPMNIEMIWGLGLLFQRESVGIVIHWFMGLLAASGVYLICREHINKAGSLLAAAVLLTMPLVTYNATGSSNDLPVMLYTVLAVHGFLHWRKNQKKEWLYLAAVMSGFAAANKYTGLYTPFALMVCLCVAIIKDRQWSQIRSLLPLCVLVTVVAGSPWYLKNLLFTGNPVWPMFYPILGGKGWSNELYQVGIGEINARYSELGRSFWDYLISPITMFLKQGAIFQRGGIGPLFLAFLPLVPLLGRDTVRRNGWLLLFSGVFFVCWVMLSQYGRFLLPALAVLTPVVACTVMGLLGKRALRLPVTIAVTMGLGLMGILSPLYNKQFAPVVFGRESRDNFLARTTWFYRDLKWMNKNLPADAVVASNINLLYYLDRPFVLIGGVSSWFDERHSSFIGFQSRLKELGVTHLLLITDERGEHVTELISRGYFQRIYHNPEGFVVKSISQGKSERVPLTVYRIRGTDHL